MSYLGKPANIFNIRFFDFHVLNKRLDGKEKGGMEYKKGWMEKRNGDGIEKGLGGKGKKKGGGGGIEKEE